MSEDQTDSQTNDGHANDANDCQSTLALKDVLNSCLEKVLSGVPSEKFVEIYKTCYGEFRKKDEIERPALSGSSVEAKKYHAQFNEIVKEVVADCVAETLSNLNDKLKVLEELTKEQGDSTVVWRPPGNVSQHMNPFECVVQMEMKKDLEEKIKNQQEVTKILQRRLLQKRNKAKELHKEVLSVLDKIENLVVEKTDTEMIE